MKKLSYYLMAVFLVARIHLLASVTCDNSTGTEDAEYTVTWSEVIDGVDWSDGSQYWFHYEGSSTDTITVGPGSVVEFIDCFQFGDGYNQYGEYYWCTQSDWWS